VVASADSAPALVDAVAARTAEIANSLGRLDEDELHAPSELDGWSRLTIACHLRYGAEALHQMTLDTLAGRTASYYPEGRARSRPRTLWPRETETPRDVVEALVAQSAALHQVWEPLGAAAWELAVREPADNPDLGAVPLAQLTLSRLTELEVHGTDLGLGLADWSDLFVRTALPSRLEGLMRRRTNHREFDGALQGSWLLHATDGQSFVVSVTGSDIRTVPADETSAATAVLEGSSRDLLALMLGRPARSRLTQGGDPGFAAAFPRAFPGP